MNTNKKQRFTRSFSISDEAQEKLTRIASAEMRSRSMAMEHIIHYYYREFMLEAQTPTHKAVKMKGDK